MARPKKSPKATPLAQLSPKSTKGTIFYSDATKIDIHVSVCGSRNKCMGAVSCVREAGLDCLPSKVSFEANMIRFPKDGYWFDFIPKPGTMEMLRDFDALGELYGLEEARSRMPARRFYLELYKVQKIHQAPPMSELVKQHLSQLHAEKDKWREEMGLPKKSSHKRYAGMRLRAPGALA